MDHKAFQKLGQDEYRELITALDDAYQNHARWLSRVNHCLVCGSPAEPADLGPEPHLHCALGEWLYGVDDPYLANDETFIDFGRAHKLVHEHARQLLELKGRDEALPPPLYQQFEQESERLRTAIRRLEDTIKGELYSHSQLLMQLFESSREGVVFSTADLRIQQVNEAFCEITGYDGREVLGNRPDMLYSEPDEDDLYEKIWLSVKKRGRWEGEFHNRRKNGERYLQRLQIQAIRNGDGQITHHLAILADITLEREYAEQLRRIAHYDTVTGLPNRMLFQDRLDREIAYARRQRALMGVLFLDLDDFKRVNDEFGHDISDQLLAQVANRLKELLRTSDSIGRFGGDEFVILAQIKGREHAEIVANKVIEVFGEPFEIDGTAVRVTASVGVSLFPEHSSEGELLIRYADFAMYHAKNSGKNRYRVFTVGEEV